MALVICRFVGFEIGNTKLLLNEAGKKSAGIPLEITNQFSQRPQQGVSIFSQVISNTAPVPTNTLCVYCVYDNAQLDHDFAW